MKILVSLRHEVFVHLISYLNRFILSESSPQNYSNVLKMFAFNLFRAVTKFKWNIQRKQTSNTIKSQNDSSFLIPKPLFSCFTIVKFFPPFLLPYLIFRNVVTMRIYCSADICTRIDQRCIIFFTTDSPSFKLKRIDRHNDYQDFN